MKNAPENSKPIFCKYLYDMTYLLLLSEYCDIPCKYYKDMFDVNVYVKHVPETERNNIEVSFKKFLPQAMRQKYIENKGPKGRSR